MLTGASSEVLFSVEFTDNPCVGAWTNIPSDPAIALDTSLIQDTGSLPIPFVGMNHGQCEFFVSVYLDT